MIRLRSFALPLGAALSLSFVVACNAIVGMEDVTLAVTSDAGDAAPDGDAEAGALVGLSGTAHFLQPGTKVRIHQGAGAVDVSANGAFTLPRVPVGTSYAVTAETLAGDQLCSVQNATGTATGDVGDVVVLCLVAKESLSVAAPGQTYTTAATSYGDFDGAAPLALTLEADVATKALVTLTLPQVGPPYNGIGGYVVMVDGKPAAEGIFEDASSGAGVPAATYAVVDLAPGTHVVGAKWRAWTLDTPPQPATFDRARVLRLGAVLLGSSPAFAEAAGASATQSTALNLTGLPATEAPAVKVTLAAAAPVLAFGTVPTIGNQSVPQQGVQGVLDLDGDRFRTQHVSGWGERNSLMMVGLVPNASPGAHTLVSLAGAISTETWAKGDASNKLPLTLRHDVIAFRPGTFAARVLAPGDRTISASAFTPLDGTATLTFSPTHDTMALVVLHEVATFSTGSGNTGELAVDLDGVRIGTSGVTSTRPLARGMNAPTLLLVKLTAGTHVLKPVFRSQGNGAEGSANVFHVLDASLSLVALD